MYSSLREGAEIHVVFVEPEVFNSPFATALASATTADAALEHVQQQATDRINALGGKIDGQKLRRVVAHFRRGAPVTCACRSVARRPTFGPSAGSVG